jgi:LacI family transcriptional regulator
VRNSYFADLFQGLITELAPEGYSLHVIPTYAPEQPDIMLQHLPPVLRREEIDGAVIAEWPQHLLPMLQQLRAEPHFGDRPIVSLLTEYPTCHAVLTDDYSGMHAAMTHLLDLGHTHFMHGYWPGDTHYTASQRLRAMQRACSERGLDLSTHIFYYGLDWDSPLARRMVKPLREAFQEHPEITAVLAPNDQYAVQAAAVLRDMGMSVPREVSLVGFDDVVPLPDGSGVNQLSTVCLPLEDVGREAARRILQLIGNATVTPASHLLPAVFVPRGTTGRPRQ